MDSFRIKRLAQRFALLVSILFSLSSSAMAVTGQGVWIAFPNGTTCPNYNTAPINDQTLCYDSVTGWQVFHGGAWVQPNLAGVLCTQLPALTGDTTTSAGSCATTTLKTNGVAFTGAATMTLPTSVANGGSGASAAVGWLAPPCSSQTPFSPPTNSTQVAGFAIDSPFIVSKIYVNISTADNSGNLYDYGLYNSAGTLITDTGKLTGSVSFASTGLKSLTLIQNASCTGSGTPSTCCTGSGTGTCPATPLTEPPGVYYFGSTGNASTLAATGCATAAGNPIIYAGAVNETVSSGGILPATTVVPGLTPSTAYTLFSLY